MISWQVKEDVRRRYNCRCGYCGLTEAQAGGELTLDHFQPLAHGGSDSLDNLVYACRACNEIKGDQWSLDPPPVLHPLRDEIVRHLRRGANGTLIALSAAGARHLSALRLNRPALIARRSGRALPRRPARGRRG